MRKNYWFLIAFALILGGCNLMEKEFYCDNEKIITQWGVKYLEGKGAVFNGTNRRSSEMAFSGEYSTKLSKPNHYGLTLVLDDVRREEVFEVGVWKYGKGGVIVATTDNADDFYQTHGVPESRQENGWEYLHAYFTIPPNLKNGKAKFYLWSPEGDEVYFDDMRVIRHQQRTYPEYADLSGLQILLKPEAIKKLERQRKRAFELKYIEKSKGWHKCKLVYEGDTIEAKLRLKGDNVDHLDGEKWSFRIKTTGDKAWKKIRTFSLHNPAARDFLREWEAHKLFEQEDVLSTRYGFVPIRLNGQSLGIYAYEEHFEKQLVEHKKRREGVIVKFSEEGFWELSKFYDKDKNLTQSLPLFEATDILPFSEKKIKASQEMQNRFQIAQNLMHEYKLALKPASSIFDLDATAKHFALVDLAQATHSITWHNQRFYYNPVLCKLQPIGFDCYTNKGVYTWTYRPFVGWANKDVHKTDTKSKWMVYSLFNEPVFRKSYARYVQYYHDVEFVKKFQASIRSEVDSLTEIIQREYSYYQYDAEFLPWQAKRVADLIPDYFKRVERGFPICKLQLSKEEMDCEFNQPPQHISLKTYTQSVDGKKRHLELRNFHCKPIEVLGYGTSKKDTTWLKEKVEIGQFQEEAGEGTITVSKKAKYLYYTAKGDQSISKRQISAWPQPIATTPEQELFADFPTSHEAYSVIGNKVVFKAGKYIINQFITIPAGYHVVFNPGVKLDFVKGAGFISKSMVEMNGTKQQPIVISSSDSTGNGFTVLQATERSRLSNVIFDQLNTLNYKGWQLTGSVTFYEADVTVENTSFLNNPSEDGLNIIRANFDLNNCNFENTFSDAFDADFCSGTLSSSKFKKLGNDAIDFSGSEIVIKDCEVINASDKGISGGEQSYLTVTSCSISDSNVGIASKDLSKLNVNSVTISNTKFGFAAYQKKPEYGGGEIIISKLDTVAIKVAYAVDLGSQIQSPSELIQGKEKLPIDKLFY